MSKKDGPRIRIDDTWSVKTDRYNWILCEKTVGKSGKDSEKQTYHITLASLLRYKLDEELKHCEGLHEIKERIDEAGERLEAIFGKVTKNQFDEVAKDEK